MTETDHARNQEMIFFCQVRIMYSGPALTGEVYKQCAVHTAWTFSGKAKHIDGGKSLMTNSALPAVSAGVQGLILDVAGTVRLWRLEKR